MNRNRCRKRPSLAMALLALACWCCCHVGRVVVATPELYYAAPTSASSSTSAATPHYSSLRHRAIAGAGAGAMYHRSLQQEGGNTGNTILGSIQRSAQQTSESIDWNLSSCCNNPQIIFCCLFGGFMILNYVLWNFAIMKPMKLIAVFVHEMSHATACWLTCGEVKAIEVYTNEGGVTKYVGGNRCCIIPAGYLGGAFWGGVFVCLSGSRIASTVIASLLCVALIVSMFFSPNSTMVFLSLGFVVLTVGFILLDWLVFDPLVQYLTLYYGVFIGTFSVYDIYDDLITRTVEGSDAHACHQLIPCCLPRCVGVQFALVALVFQAAGVYLALVWMGSAY